MEYKEKRLGRSETILDKDDILLCLELFKGYEKKTMYSLKYLITELNISHNSLLVHLKRLDSLGFINIIQNPNDYKSKLIFLSEQGIKIINLLLESPKIKYICDQYYLDKTYNNPSDFKIDPLNSEN